MEKPSRIRWVLKSVFSRRLKIRYIREGITLGIKKWQDATDILIAFVISLRI